MKCTTYVDVDAWLGRPLCCSHAFAPFSIELVRSARDCGPATEARGIRIDREHAALGASRPNPREELDRVEPFGESALRAVERIHDAVDADVAESAFALAVQARLIGQSSMRLPAPAGSSRMRSTSLTRLASERVPAKYSALKQKLLRDNGVDGCLAEIWTVGDPLPQSRQGNAHEGSVPKFRFTMQPTWRLS